MKSSELARRREAARQRSLRPYESLHVSHTRWTDRFLANVDQRLKVGWRMGAIRGVRLQPPIEWTSASRSFDTHWHAWWPLDELFYAHGLAPKDEYLQAAWDFAMDWIYTFQRPLLALPTGVAVRKALKGDGTQAWYDMSVGLRLQRLAYLTDLACRDDRRSDEAVGLMFETLDFHHRLLVEERLFKAHNNHGVFQALGQLAAAVRFPDAPKATDHRRLAEGRLRRCIDEHFFADGVHKEHSPGYHLVLLDTLMAAREHGLLDADETQWLAQAEEALSWMIMPSGMLAPFGDTDPLPPALAEGYIGRFSDENVKGLLRRRRVPQSGVRAYLEAGYVFARNGAGADADYFAQQCGFHSRTHKHADNLSFVWYARGRDILTDPGRFAYAGKAAPGSDTWNQGFWYDDPHRMYVERTYAHNAVGIDGPDHQRMGVEPFGSALKTAGESGGQMISESEMDLAPGVKWRRVVLRRTNAFLAVIDHVADAAGRPHDVRQTFTLAANWRRAGPGRYKSSLPTARQLSILNLGEGVTLEQEVQGQTEPELRGWLAANAQTLTPTPSLTYCVARSPQVLFVTLFVLGSAPSSPVRHSLSSDTSEGEIVWRQGVRLQTLTLARNEQGQIEARLSTEGVPEPDNA